MNLTSPLQNFGTATVMRVSNVDRSLLEFDLSSIPGGSNVASADLRLCFTSILPLAIGRTHELNRVTGAWTESAVTWNNQPGGSAGAPVTYAVPLIALDCVHLDVTSGVQAWVGGAANEG